MKKLTVLSLIFLLVFQMAVLPSVSAEGGMLPIENSQEWYSDYDYGDQQWLSDEEFFGLYDAAAETWTKEPYFDYETYTELSEVETAVKAGDYALAKNLITEYYKNKFKNQPRTLTSANDKATLLKAQLQCYNDFLNTGSQLADVVELSSAEKDITADVTDIVQATTATASKLRTLELVAIEKDGAEGLIYSRETAHKPYVEVEVNGSIRRYEATADTYLRGGDYAGTSYGAEPLLHICETPSYSDTMRTRIAFDFSDMSAGDMVANATLHIYGKAENLSADSKKVLVFYNSNGSGTGNLENMTWNSDSSRVYVSFNGEMGPALLKTNFSQSKLYTFVDYVSLYKAYRGTGDETYAYHAFRLYNNFLVKYGSTDMMVFADQNYGTALSDKLELGTRAAALPAFLAHLTGSEHFNAENFIPILKYAWQMANGLAMLWDSQSESGNWGIYQTAGLSNIMLNFGEFKDAHKPLQDGGYGNGKRGGWLALVQHRYALLSGNILRDDGSFTETIAYGKESLNQFLVYPTYAEEAGQTCELGEELLENMVKIGYYIMNATGPDFCDFQIGDCYGYVTSFRNVITSLARATKDPVLIWGSTNGKEGTPPTNTSIFYPDNRKLVSRSGWGDKDVYMDFLCDGGISNHNHPDDLQVVMFAYGQYLLTDQKQFNYTRNDPTRAWLYSTRAHNTVEVNGLVHRETLSGLFADPIQVFDGSYVQYNRTTPADPGIVERSEVNDGYDYVRMTTPNYLNYVVNGEKLADVSYTRSVLFLKNSKYVIVTDYLEPQDDSVNTYAQNWHMLPEAGITMDEDSKIAQSHFAGANIQVIPVLDDELKASVKDGLYSPENNYVESAPYASYVKEKSGNTTLNTVLLPTAYGTDIESETEKLSLDVADETASAFKFNMTDHAVGQMTQTSYYSLHDLRYQKQREFGTFSTDGVLAVAEKTAAGYGQLVLEDGTNLTDIETGVKLIFSQKAIPELSVTYEGNSVCLNTSRDIDLSALTIRTNGVANAVTLNGEEVSFSQSGRYVYFGDKALIEDNTPSGSDKPSVSPSGGSHGGGGGGSAIKSDPQKPTTPSDIERPSKDPSQETIHPELEGHWGAEEIGALVEQKVILGDENGRLNLTRPLTRAELAALLCRVLSLETVSYTGRFDDVTADSWYADCMETAAQYGLLVGADGKGMPNEILTREQMAKMLTVAYQLSGGELPPESELSYQDSEAISPWAYSYVSYATQLGLLNGMETGDFAPKGAVLREQAFAAVSRLLQQIK